MLFLIFFVLHFLESLVFKIQTLVCTHLKTTVVILNMQCIGRKGQALLRLINNPLLWRNILLAFFSLSFPSYHAVNPYQGELAMSNKITYACTL